MNTEALSSFSIEGKHLLLVVVVIPLVVNNITMDTLDMNLDASRCLNYFAKIHKFVVFIEEQQKIVNFVTEYEDRLHYEYKEFALSFERYHIVRNGRLRCSRRHSFGCGEVWRRADGNILPNAIAHLK